MVKLFSKSSNLCDHNSPTLQTDRQTDRQTTCDRNTALCTKVHRAVKTVAGRKRQTVQTAHHLASVPENGSCDRKRTTAGCWQTVRRDVQLQRERWPQTSTTWQATYRNELIHIRRVSAIQCNSWTMTVMQRKHHSVSSYLSLWNSFQTDGAVSAMCKPC